MFLARRSNPARMCICIVFSLLQNFLILPYAVAKIPKGVDRCIIIVKNMNIFVIINLFVTHKWQPMSETYSKYKV
jgi:hypothetical protein